MPVITEAHSPSRTEREAVLFRCTASTQRDLPVGTLSAYVLGMFDYLALGVSAAGHSLEFSNRESGAASRDGFTAVVDTGKSRWATAPPYAALSVVRQEMLRVRHLSYRNPLETEIIAFINQGAAAAVVAFLGFLNLAAPMRRKGDAEAGREEIRLAVEDATVECSVDEKFLLVESAEIDIEIKKTQLERIKIGLLSDKLGLAAQIREAQRDSNVAGLPMPVWDEDEANRFADNIRLTSSVKQMQTIGLEVQIVSDEG